MINIITRHRKQLFISLILAAALFFMGPFESAAAAPTDPEQAEANAEIKTLFRSFGIKIGDGLLKIIVAPYWFKPPTQNQGLFLYPSKELEWRCPLIPPYPRSWCPPQPYPVPPWPPSPCPPWPWPYIDINNFRYSGSEFGLADDLKFGFNNFNISDLQFKDIPFRPSVTF